MEVFNLCHEQTHARSNRYGYWPSPGRPVQVANCVHNLRQGSHSSSPRCGTLVWMVFGRFLCPGSLYWTTGVWRTVLTTFSHWHGSIPLRSHLARSGCSRMCASAALILTGRTSTTHPILGQGGSSSPSFIRCRQCAIHLCGCRICERAQQLSSTQPSTFSARLMVWSSATSKCQFGISHSRINRGLR